MADCECLVKCPFFHNSMAKMPAAAELTKRRLCRSDFTQCARYQVFSVRGRSGVPSDLYPDDRARAEEILSVTNPKH